MSFQNAFIAYSYFVTLDTEHARILSCVCFTGHVVLQLETRSHRSPVRMI